jgi:hypothetical protein
MCLFERNFFCDLASPNHKKSSAQWSCAKRLLPPAAAKDSLDGDIIFLISLREIRKTMSPSKYNLAHRAN